MLIACFQNWWVRRFWWNGRLRFLPGGSAKGEALLETNGLTLFTSCHPSPIVRALIRKDRRKSQVISSNHSLYRLNGIPFQTVVHVDVGVDLASLRGNYQIP